MASTKLQDWQKAIRKNYKKDLLESGNGFIVSYGRLTLVGQVTGENRAKIAWSIASREEKQFRRKVGEFYALDRFFNDVTMPVELWDYFDSTTGNYNFDSLVKWLRDSVCNL